MLEAVEHPMHSQIHLVELHRLLEAEFAGHRKVEQHFERLACNYLAGNFAAIPNQLVPIGQMIKLAMR